MASRTAHAEARRGRPPISHYRPEILRDPSIPRDRGRARRLGVVAVALAVLVAGCKVDATVEIRVRENGSGVVRVTIDADAEAVKAAESGGVKLEQAVRLDDLAAAGWTVGTWARGKDGSASVVLAKRFDSADAVARIVAEASGANGPLRELRARRDRGFLSTDYAVSGQADLQNVTTGVPTDPELLANLSAQSVDPNVIDQQLLAQLKAAFGLKIVIRLPGQSPTTITAKPGATTPINASSSVRDTNRLLFLVAALGFGGLAVLLWIRGGRRRGRPRGNARPRPDPGRGPRRPHVPHPHVPHPHLPHRPPRPSPPPPPPRRPPMIPPGMT